MFQSEMISICFVHVDYLIYCLYCIRRTALKCNVNLNVLAWLVIVMSKAPSGGFNYFKSTLNFFRFLL